MKLKFVSTLGEKGVDINSRYLYKQDTSDIISHLTRKVARVMPDTRNPDDATIMEVTRLINDFKETFAAKTKDPDDFLTIDELEKRWSELRSNTDVLYSDMILKLMNSVNERDIVSKKKENMNPEA